MKKLLFLSLTMLGVVFTACKDEDPPLPDNTINFSASEIGIDESESSKSITLNIDRASSEAVSVTIGITESSLSYGNDYTTNPEAIAGEISLTIPAGQTTASVTITKEDGALFDGDETVTLTILSLSDDIVPGTNTALTVTFGSIISTGSQLTLNGGEGGSMAANSVYVDFSNNEQTAVARKSWNLGLYCGNEFAVILNNTTASTAIETDISIDAIVNASDSADFAASLTLTTTAEASSLVDDWAGDLSKTVVKVGKTYVVNLGESQTPLYKVKVTQKDAETYTVQYAEINKSTVQSIDVPKDSKQSFVYISFTANSIVSAEPAKAKWDIVWGRSLYYTGTIPYPFSDLVMINARGGVEAVEVMTTETSYDAFTAANIAGITFSGDVDVIGSKWRAGGGPTSDPVVRTDRFYVIKDAGGNIYKLQFLSMGTPRGYPEIKYALVQ